MMSPRRPFPSLVRLAVAASIAISSSAPAIAASASKDAPPSSGRPEAPTDPAAIVGDVLIENAKIFVGDGRVIDSAAILVRKGRIAAVGPGVTGPASVPRIDAKGNIVSPGLIAPHTGLGLVEIGMESSTVDDEYDNDEEIRAGYDPSDAIHPRSSLIPVQVVAGVTTAAVTPTGGVLSGQVTWVDLLGGADGAEMIAKSKVAVAGRLGQSHGSSRAASLALLERTLDDAQELRRNAGRYRDRHERDLVATIDDLKALYPVVDRKIPLVVTAHRASDLLALAKLARSRRIRVVAVGATEAWRVADSLAAAKVSVLVQATHNMPASFERLGARIDNAARCAAAGVNVMIAEIGSAHNARTMTQEAGIAVANGLDYQTAISALTANVARAYGMDRDYGTIAPGKVANLVVWSGDPLELSSAPTRVLIRGREQSMRTRQSLLRDRYRDLRRFVP